MDDSFDLILIFKKNTSIEEINEIISHYELDVKLITKFKGSPEYRVAMAEREFMGTSDLEDLSEEDCLENLMWNDRSECHPRG